MDRRLAAILAVDLVGFSRLSEADEEGTLARLKALRKERIEPKIAEHHGRIVKLMGDGALVEFASVVGAVNCAAEIQRDMAARNREVPDNERLEFRVGINLGDLIVDGDDLYGDGVNVAARLEGLAEPGGICVSRTVYNHVKGKTDLAFENLGERQVKNISEPVRVYRVLLGAPPSRNAIKPGQTRSSRTFFWAACTLAVVAIAIVGAWFGPWASKIEPAPEGDMVLSLPEKPSIAVLPFANIGDDPEQEYFADGMSDDLITDLSKISGLFVVARNSVFAYKGKSAKVQNIAQDLGVRYVLEGSVRRARDQVRINAQLIDASTGGHLWAERFDGSLDDVFGLQDRVTRRIVAVLAVKLTEGEERQIARRETKVPDAYDAFLKGWQHYLRQNPENLRQAIVHFETAVELDPEYSRAYAALAATYWEVWKRFWHETLGMFYLHEPRIHAEEFLETALLDPTPLALQVSASMLAQAGRHEEAVAEAERAIALDPNDADGFVARAGVLNLAGRPGEAHQMVRRAMRLNPHFPPSYLYELGLAEFSMERFADARTSLERAVALNPEDRWSLRLLLATYGHLGAEQKAQRLMDTSAANWRGFDPLSIRGSAFWYPFKEAADAARLAAGLRRAGVPE